MTKVTACLLLALLFSIIVYVVTNITVWPEAQTGEEEPTGSPGEADESHMDEEMADLLGFLGGSGAA